MQSLQDWQQYLNPEFLTQLAVKYGLAVVFSLLIFLIGKRIAKMVTGGIKRALRRSKMDETIVGFLGNIIYGLLLAFVVIAALSQLGVETTSLAAIFAAAGLAIGLALQGSLSNFASGVLIIALRPFKAGDYVEVAGTAGTVEEVNIFTTHLRTPDNKAIIVPNGAITTDSITNFSAKSERRIDLVFGIAYDDDLRKAKDLLTEIVAADERILTDPAPTVAVSELGDNSVNFVCRPWVRSEDYWSVRFDLIETVKLQFDENGISIPFPQRDVWLHHADTPAAA